MGRARDWRSVGALVLVCCVLIGCRTQAPYMRNWEPSERIVNRWVGGTMRPHKMTSDETAVFEEFGPPEEIRFFRSASSREPVFEWIYTEREEIVWFKAGQRVDYVAVDTHTSSRTVAQRDRLKNKAVTGGFLAGVIGGLAAGLLLLSEDIGLKD